MTLKFSKTGKIGLNLREITAIAMYALSGVIIPGYPGIVSQGNREQGLRI